MPATNSNSLATEHLVHWTHEQGLLASAHDLSEGGLAQALVEGVLRFGVGARVWLDEIKSVGGIDDTAALFSESTGRVLVSVGREDDVKFVGLCEARGIPVLRIGVTDDSDKSDLKFRPVKSKFVMCDLYCI